MYDNTNASPTNRVTLTGRISSEPRYSHEIYGEAFYEFSLEVKRLSDMADTLPVVVSERLLLCCEVKVGKNVTVVGQPFEMKQCKNAYACGAAQIFQTQSGFVYEFVYS